MLILHGKDQLDDYLDHQLLKMITLRLEGIMTYSWSYMRHLHISNLIEAAYIFYIVSRQLMPKTYDRSWRGHPYSQYMDESATSEFIIRKSSYNYPSFGEKFLYNFLSMGLCPVGPNCNQSYLVVTGNQMGFNIYVRSGCSYSQDWACFLHTFSMVCLGRTKLVQHR